MKLLDIPACIFLKVNQMTKHKFWNFAKEETGERVLRLEGVVAEESWLGDEVTPKQFRDELNGGTGDLTLWINSCGGDVFAAAEIYTALKEYPYRVVVKVSALAASAASVIAMAGDSVLMAPTAMMMIHDPCTVAAGDRAEMQAAIRTLDEVKESIINAYQLKTGLSRDYISRLMTAETWMNAQKAVDMKFADGILYNDAEHKVQDAIIFSQSIVTNALLDKLKGSRPKAPPKVKVESMRRRLLVGV